MHYALEYAKDALSKAEDVELIAHANCLDNFTLHFCTIVFTFVMDGLCEERGEGWYMENEATEWFNGLSDESHGPPTKHYYSGCVIAGKNEGKDTYREFDPTLSPRIREVCRQVYEGITSKEG